MVARLALLIALLPGCVVSFDEGLLVDGDAGANDGLMIVVFSDLHLGEGKLPLGAACTDKDQCQSDICVDNRCCESTCAGLCKYCSSKGQCINVPSGKDYRSDCAKDNASTCQQDGYCDGAGKCRLYRSGTVCQPLTCVAEDTSEEKWCNGKGSCLVASSTDCSPYRCNVGTGKCYTSCTTAAQCLADHECKGQGCK
jgi:hypothetical protein